MEKEDATETLAVGERGKARLSTDFWENNDSGIDSTTGPFFIYFILFASRSCTYLKDFEQQNCRSLMFYKSKLKYELSLLH